MLSNSACIYLPLLGGLLNVKGKATRLNRIHINITQEIYNAIKCCGYNEARCYSLL